MTKIHISNIDAAKRQLETAIKLYFNEQDKVSIHTLACASHGILKSIAEKKNLNSIFETLAQRIKPEKRKYFYNKINEARNFFKHAEKEEVGATLEYQPDVIDFWIMDCCSIYEQLTGERSDMIKVYWMWFYIKHKEFLEDLGGFEEHLEIINKLESQTQYPMKFYLEALSAIQRIN